MIVTCFNTRFFKQQYLTSNGNNRASSRYPFNAAACNGQRLATTEASDIMKASEDMLEVFHLIAVEVA